jgi:Protein of unknown function (DUF2971)
MITKKRFIYKYMPVNVFTLKILINSELFFGIPKEFNDPLDCKFTLTIDPQPSIEEIRKFYTNLKLSEDEIEKKIEQAKYDNFLFQKDIENDYNENLRKEFCISCFSERNDNILMWSHYANKHKGICLKFDWKIHSEYFSGYKVIYKKKLPEITYNGRGELEAASIFLTKLNHWKYEKEIRAITKIEKGIQKAAFNPKALKGIIFGEQIAISDKQTIMNIIKGNTEYHNVEFSNAFIEKKSLKMKFRKE